MSIAKELIGYEDVAFDILKSIGAIACCDAHEEYWYRTGGLEEKQVYEYATATLKRESEYASYTNMKAFHNAIKNILDNAGIDENCPYCQKAFDE